MKWDGSEWVPLHVLAQRHDHKGHSEEMCIRCGWTMGQIPLNCQNNDTPHVFPSQQAEIERLRQTVRDRDEWNEHLVAEVSHLLLAVPRPFRMIVHRWAERIAHQEARRG
jgi:hypothetical protein